MSRPQYTVQASGPGRSAPPRPIDETPFTIGRDPANDLVLDDPRASRRHAQLEFQVDGRVVVRDLGSSNGTFAADRRIVGGAWLPASGAFRIGQTEIAVRTQFVRRDTTRTSSRRAARSRSSVRARLVPIAAVATASVGLVLGIMDGVVGVPALSRGGAGVGLAGLGVIEGLAAIALLVLAARHTHPRPPESLGALGVLSGVAVAIAALRLVWAAWTGELAGIALALAVAVLGGSTIVLVVGAAGSRAPEADVK